MTTYRALVVDFGGVLTTSVQSSFVQFAAATGIELQHLARAVLGAYIGSEDSLIADFETGRLSEDEFGRGVAARLEELSGVEVDADRIVERLFAGITLEVSMLDVVRAVRAAGLKTALLSNSWGTTLYPRERLGPLFDVVVISGEVGLRKPDPEIFTLTTDRLGVDAAACVFVDDHPGHLTGAAEAGMTTVLHREPSQTIAELESLLGLSLSGSS